MFSTSQALKFIHATVALSLTHLYMTSVTVLHVKTAGAVHTSVHQDGASY